MAGIEKICEFSGEYGSYDMYGWKYNHIQICPKFRKNFRNASHTLYVCKGELYGKSKWGSLTPIVSEEVFDLNGYERWYDSYQEFVDQLLYPNRRIVREYEYCLVVHDEHLKGKVDGCYFNQSTEMSTVKRKLKRLLKCKKLNIVEVPSNLYQYIRDNVRDKE